MQFINNVMQVINGVVGGMIALFLNMKWWGKMAVILAILAVGSCNPIRQHLAERAAAEQAREAHNRLMASSQSDLAKQPLSLPQDPVSAADREQVRLSGGQLPLLVDVHGKPYVSFVHFPTVLPFRSRFGGLFGDRANRTRLDVVQGLLLHNPRDARHNAGVVSTVFLYRELGHYGTFEPRELDLRGPISQIVFVPSMVNSAGVVSSYGRIALIMSVNAATTSQVLPTGELFVLVRPYGAKKATRHHDGDDDDSAGDDDDSTLGDDDTAPGDDDSSPTSDDSAGDDDSANLWSVKVERLNIRTGPGVEHPTLDEDHNPLVKDTVVTVTEERGEWRKVFVGEGWEGWVHSDYLEKDDVAGDDSADDDDDTVGDDDSAPTGSDGPSTPSGDCVTNVRCGTSLPDVLLWEGTAVGSARAYSDRAMSTVEVGQRVEIIEVEEHGPMVKIRIRNDSYIPAREGWVDRCSVAACE